MAHKVLIVFLVMVGCTALIAVGVHGFAYYTTPIADRAFRPDHAEMKPSGLLSHGLGIIGSAMIIVGVSMYSTRKRVRSLWNLGKLSSWLEIHIFLCLLGPVLVVYHTTFKAGGIAAISLWTMLSVAASGTVGRFLYVLIPRNIKGGELTSAQIDAEFDRLEAALQESDIGSNLLLSVDRHFAQIRRPETFGQTVRTYIRLMAVRRRVKHSVRAVISQTRISHETARTIYRAASARSSLIQRSIILTQVEKFFYYWHAIHIPFTAMMFVTLTVHVAVGIWLGYRWIF